ncbi:hypothetical protein BDB01DRAFT_894358 [Pilobolus umbonatus]|nr:hypothetical protein BDB01DRAFT_894358 [Pilobolus umbonatus]
MSPNTASRRNNQQGKTKNDVKSLKALYYPYLSTLLELFPDWSIEDLLFVMDECKGDLDMAINRISEGHASQWGQVKSKKSRVIPQNQYKKSHNKSEIRDHNQSKGSDTHRYNRRNKQQNEVTKEKEVKVEEQKPSWASITSVYPPRGPLKEETKEEIKDTMVSGDESNKPVERKDIETMDTVEVNTKALVLETTDTIVTETADLIVTETTDTIAMETTEATTVETTGSIAMETLSCDLTQIDEEGGDILTDEKEPSEVKREKKDTSEDGDQLLHNDDTINNATQPLDNHTTPVTAARKVNTFRRLNQVEAVVLPNNQITSLMNLNVQFGSLNLSDDLIDENTIENQDDERVDEMAVEESEIDEDKKERSESVVTTEIESLNISMSTNTVNREFTPIVPTDTTLTDDNNNSKNSNTAIASIVDPSDSNNPTAVTNMNSVSTVYAPMLTTTIGINKIQPHQQNQPQPPVVQHTSTDHFNNPYASYTPSGSSVAGFSNVPDYVAYSNDTQRMTYYDSSAYGQSPSAGSNPLYTRDKYNTPPIPPLTEGIHNSTLHQSHQQQNQQQYNSIPYYSYYYLPNQYPNYQPSIGYQAYPNKNMFPIYGKPTNTPYDYSTPYEDMLHHPQISHGNIVTYDKPQMYYMNNGHQLNASNNSNSSNTTINNTNNNGNTISNNNNNHPASLPPQIVNKNDIYKEQPPMTSQPMNAYHYPPHQPLYHHQQYSYTQPIIQSTNYPPNSSNLRQPYWHQT